MSETTLRFEVRAGAATNAGRHRAHNEDAYLAERPIFLVADGMGGHARGEVAARAVVEAFRPLAGITWVTAAEITVAIRRSQDAVRDLRSGTGPEPGSTVSGVALSQQRGVPCWLVFNIGDSRTYRLRAERLEQVSVDHSQAQALIDEAGYSLARAQRVAAPNVITRAIGGGLPDGLVADEWLMLAAAGDRMLICTDGLTTELTDHLIRATLLSVLDPADAAQALVEAAVTAGGRDNVTAVVIDAVHVEGGSIDDGLDADTVSLLPDLADPLDDGDTVPLLAVPEHAGPVDADENVSTTAELPQAAPVPATATPVGPTDPVMPAAKRGTASRAVDELIPPASGRAPKKRHFWRRLGQGGNW